MLTNLAALLLGVVEGCTEFLPISSTAHLILASHLLGIAESNFTKTFDIAIQSGAILAVVALYWKKFFEWEVIKKIILAFIPTAVVGFTLYPLVKTYLLGNIVVALAALALGGALLIVFEYFFKESSKASDITGLTPGKALVIGLCQAVALIPGVSRAAATMVGGMLLGIKRETIVEFSFLLAVPTMLAATGLDLIKSYQEFSLDEVQVLLVGFITSFIMAIISIKWLLHYIRHHTFTSFGLYRIIIVVGFVLFI